jgi:hypothetical protein
MPAVFMTISSHAASEAVEREASNFLLAAQDHKA